MIKAKIIKNSVATNATVKASQELAEAWVAEETLKKSFGKPERWVADTQIEAEGEDIAQAIETMVEPIAGENHTLYKFASEFSVAYEDVTAEMQAAADLQQQLADIRTGEAIYAEAVLKGRSKGLSDEQVLTVFGSSDFLAIERILKAGLLPRAKTMIQAADLSVILTSEEKTAILNKLP